MKSKLKIISSMLVFGSIGIFVRNINLPSIEIAFLRAVIGSLFLMLVGLFTVRNTSLEKIKKNLLFLVLSGTAIGVNWILLFQAYRYTTVSNATLSYYFAPVFVILLSPFILKEKLTLVKVISVVIAMAGLFTIVSSGSNGTGIGFNHIKGIAFGLSAAALYASVVLLNKFIKDLSDFETTVVQLAVAALVLFPNIIYKNNISFGALGLKTWVFIFIVGIIHTGIAYLLYFSSLKGLKGQSAAVLSYIDPISAVVFASIFLGESFTMVQAFGGVLILGSTYLSEKK